MDILNILFLIRNIVLISLMVLGVIYAFELRGNLRNHLRVPFFYGIVCFFFLLISSQYFNESTNYILLNSLIIVRSILFASIGLCLLAGERILSIEVLPLQSIKKLALSFFTWKQVLVPVAFLIYTIGIYYNVPTDILRIEKEKLLFNIVIGVVAAINEDLFYGIGIFGISYFLFNRYTNNKNIALVFSILLWSSFHYDPNFSFFLKFMQVFPLGIVMGYFRIKYGFEYSIGTHLMYNIYASMFFSFI